MPTLRPRTKPDSEATRLESALRNMTLTRVQKAARVVFPSESTKQTKTKPKRRNRKEDSDRFQEKDRVQRQHEEIATEDVLGGTLVKMEGLVTPVTNHLDQMSNLTEAENIEGNQSPRYRGSDESDYEEGEDVSNYELPPAYTVESKTDVRWGGLGDYYDEDLPPMISLDGSPATFLMREFKRQLTAEPACPDYMNIGEYLRKRDKEQDSRTLSNYFTVEFMDTQMANEPEVESVMKSDLLRYFDNVMNKLQYCQKNESCKCICEFSFTTNRSTLQLTLLHIAAAFSTPEFVRSILDPDTIKYYISAIVADEKELDDRTDQYNYAIMNWFNCQAGPDRMNPAELAAELNRPDVVEILLENEFCQQYFIRLDRKELPGRVKCFKFNCLKHDSMLGKLLENSNFEKFSKNHQKIFIENLTPQKLVAAIDIAASRGNLKAIDSISRFHPNVRSIIRGRQYKYPSEAPGIPNIKPHCSTFDQIQPAAHSFAEYGHFEMYEQLRPKEKLATDHFAFTSLLSIVQFTDSQILSQLKYFNTVSPEEAFLFVEQIIVTGKLAIIEDVMNWLLANKQFFQPEYRHQEADRITEHISLPLETVIRHGGNMMLFERIVQSYSKGDKYTTTTVRKDAVRCTQLVQDMAHRISDQMRLAVILVCIPLLNVQSDSFASVMNLHMKRGEDDEVAQHVFRYEIKKVNSGAQVSWVNALKKSKKIVSKWGGTMETDGCIPTCLVEHKIIENRETRPIISKDRKKSETRKMRVTEDEAVAAIAKAFKTFMMAQF